jgi:hypothetical protein
MENCNSEMLNRALQNAGRRNGFEDIQAEFAAFGEIECEVYSVDHQGSQMRVWYHDGIGLRVDTTIDGMKVVIDRVSISFVTSDA